MSVMTTGWCEEKLDIVDAAVREQLFVAGIRAEVDVNVSVVGLELDVRDRPDRDPAAALHL